MGGSFRTAPWLRVFFMTAPAVCRGEGDALMAYCLCRRVPDGGGFRIGRVYRWVFLEGGLRVFDDSGQSVRFEDSRFFLHFRQLRKTEAPDDLCYDCKFGRVFTALCRCPVCGSGTILAGTHTGELLCTNGCSDIPFAVDFYVERNCGKVYFYGQYTITISGRLSRDQMKALRGFYHAGIAQIYKMVRDEALKPLCLGYEAAVSLCRYLQEQSIRHTVSPALPVITRYEECHGSIPRVTE